MSEQLELPVTVFLVSTSPTTCRRWKSQAILLGLNTPTRLGVPKSGGRLCGDSLIVLSALDLQILPVRPTRAGFMPPMHG